MNFIKKEKIHDLLQKARERYDVYAPIEEHNSIQMGKLNNVDDVVLDFANTLNKPNSLIFPQLEVLFEFDPASGAVDKATEPEKQMLIFGMRPCDARSLLILDKVFNWEGIEDTYYCNRRNNAVLVVIGCNEPLSTCFCTSVGGGPMDHSGADVFLTELEDAYAVEVISQKGKEFVNTIEELIVEGDKDVEKAVDQAKQHAEEQIDTLNVDLATLPQRLEDMFDHEVWDEFHQACIGCGTCAFLCPTCHCFDIIDQKRGKKGKRIRCWDCCMYPLFTKHTSGHNPRTGQRERVRQRVMHKFQYYVANFGEIACVGCGRCVNNCPVNLDIRTILKRLDEVTSAKT